MDVFFINSKKIIGYIVILLTFFSVGCKTHLTDITIISTKEINLNKLHSYQQAKKTFVTVKKIKPFFLFCFIPFGAPTLENVVNDALEKGNGDLIINASIYINFLWLGILGESGYTLKGTVINTGEIK